MCINSYYFNSGIALPLIIKSGFRTLKGLITSSIPDFFGYPELNDRLPSNPFFPGPCPQTTKRHPEKEKQASAC
jgi:hypothetical protein